MATKIFGVEYEVTETYDGKDANTFKEDANVVAKDALDAILKLKARNEKPVYSSFIDETNKNKRVKVSRKNFKALTVILRASAE